MTNLINLVFALIITLSSVQSAVVREENVADMLAQNRAASTVTQVVISTAPTASTTVVS